MQGCPKGWGNPAEATQPRLELSPFDVPVLTTVRYVREEGGGATVGHGWAHIFVQEWLYACLSVCLIKTLTKAVSHYSCTLGTEV